MASITVTDLILNFVEACRALVPSLNRAEVPWKDGQQGDGWDRVAEALFKTLVSEPCAFHACGEAGAARLRMLPYGFLPSAECNAWFTVEDGHSNRIVDLVSVEHPFDRVRCGDPHRLVPLIGAQFAFVYDKGGGLQHRVDAVDLEAV